MTAPKKSSVKKDRAEESSGGDFSGAQGGLPHLLTVERGQSHSDDLLRGRAVNALSAADRNLATALVLGVLRWQILLDRQIHSLLARPGAKLDAEILIALRLGAFQLLHMDRIPARAAIDESVELAKQAGHRFASGMVNAVLRKLGKIPQTMDELHAHPAWMVERWTCFYGLETARAICRHGQSQPILTVRLTDPSIEDELTAAGIRLEAGELLTSARAVVSGDVTATAAFRKGRVRLQDEGSQLVAEILSNALDQKVKSAVALLVLQGLRRHFQILNSGGCALKLKFGGLMGERTRTVLFRDTSSGCSSGPDPPLLDPKK